MIKTTLSRHDTNLAALLYGSPYTAARYGVLGFVHDALTEQAPWFATAIEAAAARLLAELDVATVYDVPRALFEREGRPPARVTEALRCAEMVEALRDGLWQLGYADLSDRVTAWNAAVFDTSAAVALTGEGLAVRRELLERLLDRAQEILLKWYELDVRLSAKESRVDGRTLAVAARVWQIPLVNGEMTPAPRAAAALYANRLGRSVAAVAHSRLNDALCSTAPDVAVTEPLALLVAIGESITTARMSQSDMTLSSKGGLRVSVRNGKSLSDASLSPHAWWPVFSAWGSSERRREIVVPTAWKLTCAEADVLLWLLCRVTAQLAVVASAPQRVAISVAPFDWAGHVETKAPQWAAGVESVWSLMQRGRKPPQRTEVPATPGALLPRLGDVDSWPWRPEATDTLESVPA